MFYCCSKFSCYLFVWSNNSSVLISFPTIFVSFLLEILHISSYSYNTASALLIVSLFVPFQCNFNFSLLPFTLLIIPIIPFLNFVVLIFISLLAVLIRPFNIFTASSTLPLVKASYVPYTYILPAVLFNLWVKTCL